MKRIYLIISIIGFILPNSLVLLEGIENYNILLYTDPLATFSGMFANRISTIFAIDLLWAVMVFFVWSYVESKKHPIKHLGKIWICTMLFGLAGALPLFLYFREGAIKSQQT